MFFRLITYGVVLVSLTTGIFYLEINYSFDELKDYLNVLLAASGMVFTIMGIWIAFLYPNALQRLVNPQKIENADFSSTLSETKRLESLVGSVLKSAFVVIAIMLVFIGKILFGRLSFVALNLDTIKAITISFVVFVTYLQLEAFFHVMYSNVLFISDLHKKREDREADADI